MRFNFIKELKDKVNLISEKIAQPRSSAIVPTQNSTNITSVNTFNRGRNPLEHLINAQLRAAEERRSVSRDTRQTDRDFLNNMIPEDNRMELGRPEDVVNTFVGVLPTSGSNSSSINFNRFN